MSIEYKIEVKALSSADQTEEGVSVTRIIESREVFESPDVAQKALKSQELKREFISAGQGALGVTTFAVGTLMMYNGIENNDSRSIVAGISLIANGLALTGFSVDNFNKAVVVEQKRDALEEYSSSLAREDTSKS